MLLPLLDVTFVDATPAALVETLEREATDPRYILEVNGGGIALEDFDLDGDVDLLVVRGSTIARLAAGEPGMAPVLFLNDGSGDFEAAGDEWAIGGGTWGMGVAAGDLDRDGDPDLVLTEYGHDRVLLNQGGAGFVEAASIGPESWSSSAALFDGNGDGHLDLFVTGYLEFELETAVPRGEAESRWKGHKVLPGPEGMTPTADRLHLGRGDGTFGPNVLPEHPAAFSLGVMPLDVDGDGRQEVFVAADSMPNSLWRLGEEGWVDEAFRAGLAYDSHGREQACMGIARGDLDGNGSLDLMVTNFSGEANALYTARRPGRFRERSTQARVAGPSLLRLGWGTAAGDLDLDGDLDLFVANGHVYPEADQVGTDTSYAQTDQVFLRDGASYQALDLDREDPIVSRAAALADLDRDGDLDAVVLSVQGQVRVWRNETKTEGQGMVVRLPSGSGARVELRVGEEHQVREVTTCGGFQSAVPEEVHFGVGGPIDLLRVRWPSGREQVLKDVEPRPLLVLKEPQE